MKSYPFQPIIDSDQAPPRLCRNIWSELRISNRNLQNGPSCGAMLWITIPTNPSRITANQTKQQNTHRNFPLVLFSNIHLRHLGLPAKRNAWMATIRVHTADPTSPIWMTTPWTSHGRPEIVEFWRTGSMPKAKPPACKASVYKRAIGLESYLRWEGSWTKNVLER